MVRTRFSGVLAAVAMLTIVFSPSVGHESASTVEAVASLDPVRVLKSATVDVGASVSLYGSASRGIPALGYNWSFRDGSISKDPNPTHAYTQAGTYDVALVVQDGSGRMDLDIVTVRVRQPVPGLDFPGVDGGPDRTAWEDETLGFDGRVTWPGTNPSSLVFAWDFGDNTPVMLGALITHAFENAGSYRVRVTVTNPATGAFDVDEVLASVLNVAPVADAGPASIAGFEDDVFTIDATASSDTPSDRADLAYAWDFGDGQRGAGAMVSHAFPHTGTYTVDLTVTDDNGASSADDIVVYVENAPPRADPGVPPMVAEGDPASFDGRASADTPSDRLFLDYAWTVDPSLPPRPGWGASHTWFDEGLYAVRLTVTDDNGAWDAATISVPIMNAPPRVGITGIWWFQDEVLLEGYAFDPGADDLVFEWAVDGATWYRSVFPAGDEHPREVFGYAPNPPREALADRWRVTLTVTDDDGGSGRDEVTIILAQAAGPPRPACASPPVLPPDCALPRRDAWSVDNLSPRVDVADIGPSPAFEDLTLAFQADFVDDPDSANLDYLWEFGNGRTAAGAQVLHGFREAGTYTVVLTVADDEGDRASNAMILTVTNVPPVAAFPAPDSVQEDEDLDASGGGSLDTPSDRADLVYAWTFSDGAVGAGTNARHALTQDGPGWMQLAVIDDDGAMSRARADFDVANVRPVAEAHGPSGVLEGRPIALDAGRSADTPSDLPRLAYVWNHDALVIATGRNPVVSVAGKGIAVFELQVADDRGADDVTSLSVVIENAHPRVYAGPDLIAYGSARSVVFEGSASELGEMTALDAEWSFGDGATAAGLTASHTFTASGIYDACLTVADGAASAQDCAEVEVSLDTDGDSLLDEAERTLGTDARLFDSDGDGLTDFYEYMASNTDPTRSDTDRDRLSDWEELFPGDDGYVTSPFNPDTDNDELTDGEESLTVRNVTFLGQDQAYLATDLMTDTFYVERVDAQGSYRSAAFSLANAQRTWSNVSGEVEYQKPCWFPCIVQYQTHANFRWVNLTVDLFDAGFTPADFTRGAEWRFGHPVLLSTLAARVGVGHDRDVLGAQAFLSFSNVEYWEVENLFDLPFTFFWDNAFYVSEFRITVQARTSPLIPDGDGDGLLDGEEVGGWVAMTLNDIDALESFKDSISSQASAETILDSFTVRAVPSSPLGVDPDFDGLWDGAERAYGLDPGNPDSDSDGELDGPDPEPSVVDPYGPTIYLSDEIIEYGLIDLKTYHLTFRICDPKGVTGVQSVKNDDMLRVYELPRPKRCLDFETSFKVGITEVFFGAKFYVLAADATGSLSVISLRQPTLLVDFLDGFMAEMAKHFAGPVLGGILNGMYWALRDCLVDLADLFFNFPTVLAALSKVGAEFGTNPLGTVWNLTFQILQYLDASQNASNLYPEGSTDREEFRFSWFFGYVAGSMLLAWTGSKIATAAFKPLRFHGVFVADDVFDAATDAATITKRAGLWAKFSPSTKFMLGAAALTASFSLASYVWPEIFQGVFSQFTSVAFPAFVLGSMVNPGSPGGPNPARRAVVLFDGYVSGAVPGPEFFHTSVGFAARDSVMASAEAARKVWRYIRGAGDADVFAPGLGSRRVHRFAYADPRLGTSLLAGDGTLIPNLLVLLEGDSHAGMIHIRNRHILGTDLSGQGRLTLFPQGLSERKIMDIMQETIAKGQPVLADAFAIDFDFHGRYGIDRMRVVFTADGTIKTAYPIDGPGVVVVRPG